MDNLSVEGILYALSDPVRARIYMGLAAGECAKTCSAFININEAPLPKSTLSQHFKILREAGLIRSERKGVELHNKTRCDELKDSYGPMIESILKTYQKDWQSEKA